MVLVSSMQSAEQTVGDRRGSTRSGKEANHDMHDDSENDFLT